ncbi:MAG: rhomboid family intramembrane serine protease [Sedimentisphaerales bacterium]|nr:rhomboid family intramembrane serine protease [Sedimentisphaerales bacterium]
MIPIGTDNILRRRPVVNHILIAINIAIFILTYLFFYPDADGRQPALEPFYLWPQHPQLHQFLTCAFLHGGLMHLAGNMFFLYVFGGNVNDKLGNLGYLLFYLAGAIFSSLGYAEFDPVQKPVLGASGAVAAVTGAYMVLFPKTNIRVLYFFILIGTIDVPAFYFILFKLIFWDNVFMADRVGGIATNAHLAGYAFGIAVPFAMLALKLLPHSTFDLWAVFSRWRRRKQYQQMTQQGYNAFSGLRPHRKTIFARVTNVNPHAEEIMDLRSKISDAVSNNNLTVAADYYRRMVALDAEQVLAQQVQLDIANHLMQSNEHQDAAAAYEAFLRQYRTYPFVEQVQLMLGLLYSRYLNRPAQAREHLTKALERLHTPTQVQMAKDELARLG